MGLGRFELPTPRLSSVCSNQLSYRPQHSSTRGTTPVSFTEQFQRTEGDRTLVPSKLDRRA